MRYTIQNLIYPPGNVSGELYPKGVAFGDRRPMCVEIDRVNTLQEIVPYIEHFDLQVIDNEEGVVLSEDDLIKLLN